MAIRIGLSQRLLAALAKRPFTELKGEQGDGQAEQRRRNEIVGNRQRPLNQVAEIHEAPPSLLRRLRISACNTTAVTAIPANVLTMRRS